MTVTFGTFHNDQIKLLETSKEKFDSRKFRSFVNFDPVVIADTTLGYTILLAVFFSILKFGKLLRLT